MKAKRRREFCRRMGWELRIGKGRAEVVGADGRVLLERNEGYVNGYLDGMMDGMEGTIWKSSRRSGLGNDH